MSYPNKTVLKTCLKLFRTPSVANTLVTILYSVHFCFRGKPPTNCIYTLTMWSTSYYLFIGLLVIPPKASHIYTSITWKGFNQIWKSKGLNLSFDFIVPWRICSIRLVLQKIRRICLIFSDEIDLRKEYEIKYVCIKVANKII